MCGLLVGQTFWLKIYIDHTDVLPLEDDLKWKTTILYPRKVDSLTEDLQIFFTKSYKSTHFIDNNKRFHKLGLG